MRAMRTGLANGETVLIPDKGVPNVIPQCLHRKLMPLSPDTAGCPPSKVMNRWPQCGHPNIAGNAHTKAIKISPTKTLANGTPRNMKQ